VTDIIQPNKTVLGIVGIGLLDKAVTEAEIIVGLIQCQTNKLKIKQLK
jgi:hypothetical protein